MLNWLGRRKWLLTNVVLITALISLLGISVADRTEPQMSLGVGQFEVGGKVITIGSKVAAAGSVDYTCDGTDDDVQWQAAIDDLPAGGGHIVVLSGDYYFSTPVVIDSSNIHISGAGRATNIIADADELEAAIWVDSPDAGGISGILIENLAVNLDNKGYNGIQVWDSDGDHDSPVYDIRINNVYVEESKGMSSPWADGQSHENDGFVFQWVTYGTIENCYVYHCGDGIAIKGCTQIRIDNFTSVEQTKQQDVNPGDCSAPIDIHGANLIAGSQFVTIENVHAIQTKGHGITMSHGSNTDISIIGGSIEGLDNTANGAIYIASDNPAAMRKQYRIIVTGVNIVDCFTAFEITTDVSCEAKDIEFAFCTLSGVTNEYVRTAGGNYYDIDDIRFTNNVNYDTSFVQYQELLKRGTLSIPELSVYSEDNVNTGATVMLTNGFQVTTGVGANSRGSRYGQLFGLGEGAAPNWRNIDWDKKIHLSFTAIRLNSDTEVECWIQFKHVNTSGNLASKGVGIKVKNLDLYGESYGIARGEVNLNTTMVDSTSYQIDIVIDPDEPIIMWYIDGVLEGVQTIANNIPTSGSYCYNVITIQNGATGGTACYFWSTTPVVWHED